MNSSRNHEDYDFLQQAISEVSELVDIAKSNCYDMSANKLSNSSTSSKTY